MSLLTRFLDQSKKLQVFDLDGLIDFIRFLRLAGYALINSSLSQSLGNEVYLRSLLIYFDLKQNSLDVLKDCNLLPYVVDASDKFKVEVFQKLDNLYGDTSIENDFDFNFNLSAVLESNMPFLYNIGFLISLSYVYLHCVFIYKVIALLGEVYLSY
ncbi:MAG: hypothetical protein KatS3mg091_385 [Patescibacteria group bacterium]|nr:MAG: hypothetical protein KatS3mg091_385 [Patescibacteria group bacterium]